jgi:hypothetical protein
MGMPLGQRFRARLNFVPCLSLIINPFGFAIGVWAVVETFTSSRAVISGLFQVLAIATFIITVGLICYGVSRAWQLSAPVLIGRRQQLRYVLRVNPIFVMVYWLWWSVSLVRGFAMYVGDGGLVWQRTEKIDANRTLIRVGRSSVQ